MTARPLAGYIKPNVAEGSYVTTDEHGAYRGLRQDGFKHFTVNHSAGEYVRNYCIHTNGIESFEAHLKRGHYGIYHYMSRKHFHRSVNEFTFPQNTAQDGTMIFIDKTIARMIGKRLTYKGIT